MRFVEFESLPRRDRYQWMIRSIIPRPIALVSTLSESGTLNLAPFSFFNGVSADPPIVSLAIASRRGRLKDTVANVRHRRELVVNLVTEQMLDPMVIASGEWEPEVDEFALSRLHPVQSDLVAPPRVSESPLSFECRLESIVEIGDGAASIILARIVGLHVDEAIIRDGFPAPDLLQPIARLGGGAYATLGTLLDRARPDERNVELLERLKGGTS